MEGITPSRKGFTMISVLKTAAGVAIGVLISGGITMGVCTSKPALKWLTKRTLKLSEELVADMIAEQQKAKEE